MFWIQNFISSLIHLATAPIQNQKCPKNAKNACEDTQIVCHNVPWRMETLWAKVDSASPTPQNKAWWKVKYKLEELMMAKRKKRRSPYSKICVNYVSWSWCQDCLHKFTLHSNDRTIKAFDLTLPLTSFLRSAKWMNWRCSFPPSSTPCHPWSCSASKC